MANNQINGHAVGAENGSTDRTNHNKTLLYGLEENPSWIKCLWLGLQHCLLSATAIAFLPIILGPGMCMFEDDIGVIAKTQWASSLFFLTGMVTVFQCTLGTRLPIFQGSTYTVIPPILAVLSLSNNICPTPIHLNATNGTDVTLYNDTDGQIVDGVELWQRRMREIQGSLATASVIEVIIGLSGATTVLMRYIGPLTIGPVVALIGYDLCSIAIEQSATNWIVSMTFYLPYPGHNGLPTVSVRGLVAMTAAVFAGIAESIGDYHACANIVHAPPPPSHAVARGITVEGVGCVCAGLMSASGSTSFSNNLAATAITRVASRRVMVTAGLLMIIFGIFGKFGAVIIMIPTPVLGGVFLGTFGLVSAIGLATLQYVDLTKGRNQYIVGISILFGLGISQWMKANPEVINTGVDVLDDTLTVILKTAILVGGGVACFLDNTVPGTLAERGMIQWKKKKTNLLPGDKLLDESCYDLPFERRFKFMDYIPIFAEYDKRGSEKTKTSLTTIA